MPAHALRPGPALPARLAATLAVLLAGVVTLLGATALVVTSAVPAAAHDRLLTADPEDGAQLDTPPSQIVLTFSGDVLPSGAQLHVVTPDGSADGEVSVDGAVLTAVLPDDLPAGAYDVTWRVVSSDGHPIEGELSYEVAAASEPQEEPDEGTDASPSPTSAAPTDDAADAADAADTADTAGGHDHTTGVPGAELDDDGEAGWATSWLFGVAVLAIVAVAAAVMLGRRRMQQELDDREPRHGEHDAPSGDDRPGDGPQDGPGDDVR